MTPYKWLRLYGTTASAAMVVLLAVLCLGSAEAWAATCTVSLTTDTQPNGVSGELRFCLNNFSAGDTIDITATGTIPLTSALPAISQNVTINGPGANLLTISGGGANQVFSITSGTVTISGLTISGGSAAGGGAAISQASGSLTVTGCEFANNSSSSIGGGAIYAGGNLTVSSSTFRNNSANSGTAGGAIHATAVLTITNSTFSGNSASNDGGAVAAPVGTGTTAITNNTFSDNSASGGGAIYNGGTLTANNNIFTTNSASSGGGILNFGTGTITAASNNLMTGDTGGECSGGSGCPTNGSNGNQVGSGINVDLSPLGYYGGTTRTFLPQPGSQAICAGSASLATSAPPGGAGLSADQRGFGMNPSYSPCSGSVDIGAVQANYIQVQASTDAGAGASDCNPQGASCTLRDAILLANSIGYGDIDFASGVSSITLSNTGTLTLSGTTGINIVGPGASTVTVNGGGEGSNFSVFTVNASVPALIYGLTVSNGDTSTAGGGINNSGTLTVADAAISGNSAGNGGGISNPGTLTVVDSTISGNSAISGGGIANSGTLQIAESTVAGNSANSGTVAAEGGGIWSNAGPFSVVNSTIAGNSVSGNLTSGDGGGIFVAAGSASLANTVVSANSTNGTDANTGGAFTDGGGNVIGGGSNATNNLVGGTGAQITLSPLQLNGNGATVQTMIPLPGSPAICAGESANIASGLSTDERGYPLQPTGGYCPTGAVDAGAVQTNYSLVFTANPPSSVTIDQGFGAAVTLNESGNPFSASSVNIPLTISSGTLSGTTTEATSGGLATYSGLSATLGSNLMLSATIPLNPALTTPLSLSATSSDISVAAAPTAVALTPASQSSTVNQPLTFTATVSPNVSSEVGASNVISMTGTVAFSVGGQQISNCVSQPATYNPANGTATATCTTSTLLAGNSQSITAVFTPGGSTSSDYEISPVSPVPVTANVSKATTTTNVVSTSNSSSVNQQLAFTATVTPQFPGTTLPTGTVSFAAVGPAPSSAQTAMCTETIANGTVPVCLYGFTASGTYTVVATYNVLTDPNFTTSASPSSGAGADVQTVNAGSNSVVLLSSLNPSLVNQPVTFSATISVSNSGTTQPIGSVVYADGGVALPGCTFGSVGSPVTFTGGVVPSCTVALSSASSASPPVVTHSIVATFTSANTNFNSGPSNTVVQTVNEATPVTNVTSLPNPAAVGATVTATATVTPPFVGTALPSGNVIFSTVPATTSCTETIVAGVVPTCSFTFTAKNSYVIVAAYQGDSNFIGSSSPSSGPSADVEAVGVEATTVGLASSTPANTSLVNQSVTFSATINLTAGTTTNPTGTVVYKDGATVLCTFGSTGSPATFAGGAVPTCTATLFTATTSSVTHAITASYSGDSNFGPSTGNLTQTVNPAATATTIVSTVASVVSNSAPLNTPVTYAATVTPTPAPTTGSLSPTGTVTFQYMGTNGTSPSSPATLCAAVGVTAASGLATASCVGLLPTAGTYAITATYNGDQNFSASNKTNPPNAQTVTKGATTTSVVSSSTTSSVNQSVAFTATVVPSLSGGTAVPTGTVSFVANGPSPGTQTPMCTETISNGAVPICNYTFTASGTYTVVATYNVLTDPNFATSSSPSSGTGADVQTVNAGSNSVVLSPSLNPSVVDQPVTFNATISVPNSGSAQPIGSVVYADGGVALPGCTFGSAGSPLTFTNGIVPSCTVAFSSASSTSSPVVTHSIVATFTTSNTNFNSGPSNTVTQTVNKNTPITTVTSSPNPSAVNTQVTATATVTPTPFAGTAVPSGNVVFTATPVTVTNPPTVIANCTATIVAGTPTTCPFTFPSKNTYNIVATYQGDANFNGSASPSSGAGLDVQTVSVQATTVTLTSTTPPTSVVNQSVTFNATINLTAGTTTNPTGIVSFNDGATVLCTFGTVGSPATFAGGAVPPCTATLFTATTPSVTHAITASYSGDSNFGPSTGNLTQTVTPVPTTTTVTGLGSALLNVPVTFTATVTPNNPPTTGSVPPTGAVNFTYNLVSTPAILVPLCTGVVPSPAGTGVAAATCTAQLPAAGSYTINATYSGDNNFEGDFPNSPNTGGSSVTSSFSVKQTATSTSLVSSSPTTVATKSVTFSVIVTPAGTSTGTLPTGTVTFSSPDAATNALLIAQCTTTGQGPGMVVVAGGKNGTGVASCPVLFPQAYAGDMISVTATYNGDTNYEMSNMSTLQTVQNFAVAFTAPTSGTAVLLTQGFSNATDPYNPAPGTITPITVTMTPSGGLTDPLSFTCSVTTLTAIPSAQLAANQPVTDPSCSLNPPSFTPTPTSGATPITVTVSASPTAPVGSYLVVITGSDTNVTTLSQATTSLTVNVAGVATALTVAPGVTGTVDVQFSTATGNSSDTLKTFACGNVEAIVSGLPSGKPFASTGYLTCTGPSGGVALTVPSTSVQIAITPTAGVTAQLRRSGTMSLAAFLGLPLFALLGWAGTRKSPRRNFFRFLGLVLLMIGTSYAVSGCGNPPAAAGAAPTSVLKPGSYDVQVIATDQNGAQYYAVVPLTVNAD